MYLVELLTESFGLITALLCGLYAFKYLSAFWKILFFQLLTYIIAIIIAYGVTSYQYKMTHDANKMNNQWVYNLFMLPEFFLLIFAAYAYFKHKIASWSILVFIAPFILIYGLQIYRSSFWVFAHYAYISMGIIFTFIFSLFIYFLLKDKNTANLRNPHIYAAIGLVLFFAVTVPYLGMINYFPNKAPTLGRILFYFIIDNLANIRYLLLAVAFWLVRRNALINRLRPLER